MVGQDDIILGEAFLHRGWGMRPPLTGGFRSAVKRFTVFLREVAEGSVERHSEEVQVAYNGKSEWWTWWEVATPF